MPNHNPIPTSPISSGAIRVRLEGKLASTALGYVLVASTGRCLAIKNTAKAKSLAPNLSPDEARHAYCEGKLEVKDDGTYPQPYLVVDSIELDPA